MGFIQLLALLQSTQLQQLVNQVLQTQALVHNLRGKHDAVWGGQIVLQQLARAAYGGDRAFQLMGQGAYVAFNVVAPLKALSHGVHGLSQLAQLAGHIGHRYRLGHLRRVSRFIEGGGLNLLRIVAQAAHMHHKPPGYGTAYACRQKHKQQTSTQNFLLCAIHDFLH